MLNKVQLIGNLGRDPELVFTTNGKPVVNIDIATTKTWNDSATNEKHSDTEWHHIVFYNKSAETVAKYLKKGSKIYIEGKLKTRTYEKNGMTIPRTEIISDNMIMLGAKSDTESKNIPNPTSSSTTSSQRYNYDAVDYDFDEDIPF
jgi:single-strand DNA-binding protein